MFGEVCIQFTDSTTEYIASYVNNIPTTEAGTHESGFKTGMTRAFKEWAKKLGLIKEKDKEFEGDDLREGMTAIVRIKITNPVFEGQTKTKLGSSEAYTMMNDLSYTKFCEWIEDNKEVATSLINNALAAAQRREKIKKINEAEKKKVGKGTAPLAGKIAVCTLKDKSVNEFIVVEGDSAGGSAKQARDRRFQSIMPSKGKIMNTEKQKLENVLASEELKIFNTAIGTGTLDNYKEEDGLIFLTLSRATQEKGIFRMIQMAKKFKEKGKKFIWFISCSLDQIKDRNIITQIKSIPEFVIIAPSIYNKMLIKNCDYLVQLSDTESFCYSAYEALQRQVPVILTDFPEARNIVDEGENGYIVKMDLSDLDVDKIFNQVPKADYYIDRCDKDKWIKVFNGEL